MYGTQTTLNRHFYYIFYNLITLQQIASLYYLFCHFSCVSICACACQTVWMLVDSGRSWLVHAPTTFCPGMMMCSFHIIRNYRSTDFMCTLKWTAQTRCRSENHFWNMAHIELWRIRWCMYVCVTVNGRSNYSTFCRHVYSYVRYVGQPQKKHPLHNRFYDRAAYSICHTDTHTSRTRQDAV